MKLQLNERVTDELYSQIINYISDYLMSDIMVDWSDLRYVPNYFKLPESPSLSWGGVPGYEGKVRSEGHSYADYRRLTGDTKVIFDQTELDIVAQKLTIHIVPGNTYDAGATMNNKGVLTVYMRDWKLDLDALRRKPGVIVTKDAIRAGKYGACPTLEDAKNFFESNKDQVFDLIAHELKHFINSVLSNTPYRATGQHKSGMADPANDPVYANSTEELDARFIQFYTTRIKYLFGNPMFKPYPKNTNDPSLPQGSYLPPQDIFGYHLIYFIATRDQTNFVRGLFHYTIYNKLSGGLKHLWDLSDYDYRKRFVLRLNGIYDQFVDGDSINVQVARKMIKDGEPPLYTIHAMPEIPMNVKVKPNMRKKQFTPKTQPRTKERPEQTIAERFRIVKPQLPIKITPPKVNEVSLTKKFLNSMREGVEVQMEPSSYDIDARYIDHNYPENHPRRYKINIVRGDCLAKELGSDHFEMPDPDVLSLIGHLQLVAPQYIRELDSIITKRDLHDAYKDSREIPNPS